MSELPHVTSILKDAGLVNTQWFTDHMRERGTALHKAIELHNKNDLNPDSIASQIEAPFAGYMKFLQEVQPEILASEEKVIYSGVYQGTLDIRLRIMGREGVLDIKGQKSPTDRLQVAGYAMTFDRPLSHWNLYLRIKEGDYRLVEHKRIKQDRADWMAAVRIAAWRKKHGLLNERG